jgi:hypothetical protein
MRFWQAKKITGPESERECLYRQIMLIGVLGAYFTSLAAMLYGWVAHGHSGDFFMLYEAAQRPWTSATIYRMEEAELYMRGEMPHYAPYIYAPHYLLPLLLIHGMEQFPAEFLWLSVHALVLVCVLFLPPVQRYAQCAMVNATSWVPPLHGTRFSVQALCFLLPSIAYAQLVGHPVASAAAGVILAIALLNTWPVLAGILFGYLTFKLQLVLLVPFLLLGGRYWRAAIAMGVTVAVLAAFGTWALGLEVWLDYAQLMQRHAEVMQEKHGQGLQKLFVSSYALATRLGAEPWLASSIQLATAAIGAYGAWFAGRTRNVAAMLMLFAAGSVLASPYIYLYDMIPVVFAVLLLALPPQEDKQKRGLIFLLLLWPLVVYPHSVQWMCEGLLLALLVWVLGYEWARRLPVVVAHGKGQ